MISRVSGLLRDMAMAFSFGTNPAVAAFMMAFRFSHLLRRIFGEGCLQSAFIPHFEELRNQHSPKAYAFFRDLSVGLSVLLLTIILLIIMSLGAVLIWVPLSEGNREILWLTLLMMPSLLFICLFGLNTAFLQCERCYFMPGVAPVAFNLISVAAALALWKTPVPAAMPWLAGATVVACFFQWLMTVPKTYSILKEHLSSVTCKGLGFFSEDVRRLGGPFILGLIGVASMQINTAVDSIFARYADPEGPAFLWYAIRIQQLPLALFGIALSGALLPPLSRAAKTGDLPNFRLFLTFAVRRSIGLMLPMTVALLLMGDGCINLLYGRGDFDGQAIWGTTLCLWGYALGLIPSTLVLLFAPAFYAQGNYRLPTLASVLSMVLNIILNALMINGLGLGPVSVALTTSFSALFNLSLLGKALSKQTGPLLTIDTWGQIGKVLISTGIAGIAAFFASYLMHQPSTWLALIGGTVPHFPKGFSTQFLSLAVPAAFFGITLFLSAWLTRTHEILNIVKEQVGSQ